MGSIVDSELEFLSECDNEQLCLLADILVFDPKDKKKRYTETLSKRSSYVAFYPHYMKKLVPDIVDEYRRFGGNTIFNYLRGHGASYRDILGTVCGHFGISSDKSDSVEVMETALLRKVAEKMLDSLSGQNMADAESGQSAEELKEYLRRFCESGVGDTSRIAGLIIYSWGMYFSRVGLSVVKWAGERILWKLPLGPLFSVVGTVWMAFDIAAPALRVTIPATVLIACLRRTARSEQ